jgi:hypothetical protein
MIEVMITTHNLSIVRLQTLSRKTESRISSLTVVIIQSGLKHKTSVLLGIGVLNTMLLIVS